MIEKISDSKFYKGIKRGCKIFYDGKSYSRVWIHLRAIIVFLVLVFVTVFLLCMIRIGLQCVNNFPQINKICSKLVITPQYNRNETKTARTQANHKTLPPSSTISTTSNKSQNIEAIVDSDKQKQPNQSDNRVLDILNTTVGILQSKASHILDTTANMLSKTTLLLGLITFVFIVFSVILAVFGIKWLTKMIELDHMVKETKRMKLDAALLSLYTIPEMYQTQQIPDRFKRTLKEWNNLFEDKELKEIISNEPRYGYISFAAALYQISMSENKRAIKFLIDVIANPLIVDEDLLDEVRFRLGITYRTEGKYLEAWQVFSEMKSGRKRFKRFSQAVTIFAHIQSFSSWNDTTKNMQHYEYTKKDSFENLIRNTFDDLKMAADENDDIVTMQFLTPEFAGYILEKDEQGSFLPSDIKDQMKTTFLPFYTNRAIELSKIMLPLQIDSNIKANWNYALALLYYYKGKFLGGYTSEIKEEFDKKIKLAMKYAEEAEFIYSEERQAPVDKEKFIEEINTLGEKFRRSSEGARQGGVS